MLKRITGTVEPLGAILPIEEASFPLPFPRELEFNSPVHGNWNIVHTGMLMPETIQIYVCAKNCMRGVVLTAAEMKAEDRFSYVIIDEEDLLEGNLEDITIEGTADVIRKLPKRPRAVLLFTVCVHHFLGCNLDYVYEELEKRFPDIFFLRCFMDPIMQKNGLTPEQKERKAMFDALPQSPADAAAVSILGSDFAVDETSDLARILRENGVSLRQIQNCDSWEDYEELGESGLFLSIYPAARYGAELQAERLGRKHLYLPSCFDYEEIARQRGELTETLGISCPDAEAEIAACETALKETKNLMGDTPVVLDYLLHPRPLGLTRMLLTHGFQVKRVYLDAVSPEEEKDFQWLQTNAPKLELASTIHPKMRVLERSCEGKVLALGQKAAWFTQTPYFVNMTQGGGLYGFDGVCRLMKQMREAFVEEKDISDLVVRKGWGCESCI